MVYAFLNILKLIHNRNFIKKNFNENVYNAYCRTFGSWIGYWNIQRILKTPVIINDDTKRPRPLQEGEKRSR